MVRRLQRDGHECVAFDVDPSAVDVVAGSGARGVGSLRELAGALGRPRHVWIMVPAAVVDGVVGELVALLDPGDTVVDGGNSYFGDDVERARRLHAAGVDYVDVGTSGGVLGLERGYCLMIGGDDAAVARLAPVFTSLAPGVAAAPRSDGRRGVPAPEEQGWLHVGPVGAGHFVKMVHNGIEYGLMAAYAEGLNVLQGAKRYDVDVAAVAELWRRGSVIESRLLDLTAVALHDDPDLAAFSGHVADSGEGRWTVLTAVDQAVPVPVLSAALFQRFSSRGGSTYADKVLSAMRQQFGGHQETQQETRP